MFFYTNAAHKPWGDYLVEIDIGIWEQKLDDEMWAAWVQCKREITEVALKYGGSITACHGSTREGRRRVRSPGDGRRVRSDEEDQACIDPNNIMSPGKNMLDLAYED